MISVEQESKDVVVQDNELIEACYTMTLREKQLLLLGISKVNPHEFPKKDNPFKFSVTTEEWNEYFPGSNAYRDLKTAAKLLRPRFVKLHDKANIEEEINWFDSIRYYKGEGRVEMRFGWSVQVRLSGMIEKFTKVDLLSVSKLNSIYSVRLYELLMQFKSTGYRVISVEDFRFSMDCVKAYPRYADLKRKVLMPAVNEINAKSEIDIKLEELKKGRSIVQFMFTFKDQPQKDLFGSSRI